jgi:hypothetical protein
MNSIKVNSLSQSTILFLYSEKDAIDLHPEYQRESDIWSIEKEQLLIDSVINGFDLPKFYMEEYSPPKKTKSGIIKYGVIDGKQRLQALWKFIDGKLKLSEDFDYFSDKGIDLKGKTYKEIAEKFPKIKIRFDSFLLSVMIISTDDEDRFLIDDMFYRLNEAEPLNAPEKRNAKRGALVIAIRELARAEFFIKNLSLKERRYNYHDLAAKFCMYEHENGPSDTKRRRLDLLVDSADDIKAKLMKNKVEKNLTKMSLFFSKNDPLLKQVGMISLYYLVFREVKTIPTDFKDRLKKFESDREKNKNNAMKGSAKTNYDLIEFDRLSQSPNDKSAQSFRLKVLREFTRI